MVRVVAILAGIFLVAYVAVHLGYARLEKELLGRSCCGITELPITELPSPVNENQAEGVKSNQPVSGSPVTNMPQAPTPSKPEVQKTKENSEEPTDAGSLERSPADAPPPLPAEGQPVNNENPDFQVIAQRNIFQLVQEEQLAIPEEQLPATIPQTAQEEVPTTLNLTLLGTVLGDDQTSRAIIIEEKQKEQKLYQIGDAVQGAIIESIERGKVILEVFGAKETLMMKKREGGGPSPPRLPPRISRPTPRPVPDPVQDDIEEVQEDELIEETQVQTTRRPPSIRPHRRINFRRNPIRNTPETPGMDAEEEDFIEEEMPVPEEELPPLD
ncbi:MAG: type II secretion system protein N [Candidatus Electrothrix sp. Rat3]|nr:type II secretion system protein N [Candidatus Electrothrix rattekaaiensis]